MKPLDRYRGCPRIVIVGGPRCGKSTLARQLREQGAPTFCGDPRSKVKEPEEDVTYLPEGFGMGPESSRFVADVWFAMPGPWVCEGHVMARALRKWASEREWHHMPCDRIIVLAHHHPDATVTAAQAAMHRGVIEKTWAEIAERYAPITEHR